MGNRAQRPRCKSSDYEAFELCARNTSTPIVAFVPAAGKQFKNLNI